MVDWISLQDDDSLEEIQMHLHRGNLGKQVLHSSKEINVKVSLASNKKGWVIFLQFNSKDVIFHLPQYFSHKTDNVAAPLWETVFKHCLWINDLAEPYCNFSYLLCFYYQNLEGVSLHVLQSMCNCLSKMFDNHSCAMLLVDIFTLKYIGWSHFMTSFLLSN